MTAVVAIGGGHGLAATLQALRRLEADVTAVVSVADDGGSSGRLRRQLGIVPPGDLRKCLVALSDPDDPAVALAVRAFEHRFEGDDLAGHALGNLVIAGLVATAGDLQAGLDAAARLVRAAGRVVPATTGPVELKAEVGEGSVFGQSAVAREDAISSVSLVPSDAQASPAALEALAGADLVVMGPGSLFTSVLAAVVAPGLADAVNASPGRRVYVANLRPQPSETLGYDVAAHLGALCAHGVRVDVVLADSSAIALGDVAATAARYPGQGPVVVVDRSLARPNGRAHDPAKLAAALSDLVG